DEQGAVSGLRLGGGFESRPVFEARAPEGALLGPRPTRPVRQFHARVRAETLRWTVVDEFGETGDHLVPVTGEGAGDGDVEGAVGALTGHPPADLLFVGDDRALDPPFVSVDDAVELRAEGLGEFLVARRGPARGLEASADGRPGFAEGRLDRLHIRCSGRHGEESIPTRTGCRCRKGPWRSSRGPGEGAAVRVS